MSKSPKSSKKKVLGKTKISQDGRFPVGAKNPQNYFLALTMRPLRPAHFMKIREGFWSHDLVLGGNHNKTLPVVTCVQRFVSLGGMFSPKYSCYLTVVCVTRPGWNSWSILSAS